MDSLLSVLDPRLVTGPLDVREWRESLKWELCQRRNFRSDWSGKSLLGGCHLHESIVTRANVPRGISWSWMIFAEVNCLLLLPEEHIPHPPSREWSIQYAYKMYGRDVVRDWYYSLPFRSFPFQLP